MLGIDNVKECWLVSTDQHNPSRTKANFTIDHSVRSSAAHIDDGKPPKNINAYAGHQQLTYN